MNPRVGTGFGKPNVFKAPPGPQAFSAIRRSPEPGGSPRLKRQYRPHFSAEFTNFGVYRHSPLAPIVVSGGPPGIDRAVPEMTLRLEPE